MLTIHDHTVTPPPPPHPPSHPPQPLPRHAPPPPATNQTPHAPQRIPRLRRHNPLDRRSQLRPLHILATTPPTQHPPRSPQYPERSRPTYSRTRAQTTYRPACGNMARKSTHSRHVFSCFTGYAKSRSDPIGFLAHSHDSRSGSGVCAAEPRE